MSGFNSRPRVAGDHMFSYVVAALEAFQFTPARGGRRELRDVAGMVGGVSIHARAWRAT